ncbi:MAG: HAMP domain-containing sensor histidine kinase [Patescibacteria group bacterium]
MNFFNTPTKGFRNSRWYWSLKLFEIKTRKGLKHLSVFSQFVLLGIVIFLAIGIFLSMLVGPLLTSFVLKQQELNSSVFFNRLAAELLLPEDLVQPAVGESKARFERFADNLQFPGLFRIKIWNPRGTIVYSDEEQLIGRVFPLTDDLKNALALKSEIGIKIFDPRDPHDLYEVEFGEGIEFYAPITFSESPHALGVVEVYGRSGFLKEQIKKVQNQFNVRVILSLALVFSTLSFIVWRASRTIKRQGQQLAGYTLDLESKIRERTRALHEETEKKLEQAEEIAKLKDEFVFIAAHELRSPVLSIVGNTELLSSGLPSDKISAQHKAILKDLTISGRRLQDLVRDLLDVARLESRTQQAERRPTNITPIIHESVLSVTSLAHDKSIALVIEEKGLTALPPLSTDGGRLKEVLNNLLTNAIKYNRPDGSVTVSAEYTAGEIIIHVRDTGIGLSPEEKEKIFNKFWRAKTTVTEGTGLGLWITKEIMKTLGGTITLISESGVGSTFSIHLPHEAGV